LRIPQILSALAATTIVTNDIRRALFSFVGEPFDFGSKRASFQSRQAARLKIAGTPEVFV